MSGHATNTEPSTWLFVYNRLWETVHGTNGVEMQMTSLFSHIKKHTRDRVRTVLYSPEIVPTSKVEQHVCKFVKAPRLMVGDDPTGAPHPLKEFWLIIRERPDIVIGCDSTLSTPSALCVGRFMGCVPMFVNHSDMKMYLEARDDWLGGWCAMQASSWCIYLSGAITVTRSHAMKKKLRQVWGLKGRIEVCYPGIDLSDFCSTPPEETEEGEREREREREGGSVCGDAEESRNQKFTKLLYVGRISKEKRVIILYSIMEKLGSDFTLTLVGNHPSDGPQLPDRHNVHYIGEVRDKVELANIYRAHDAFLFASNFDTFGRVVPEAMACGCVPIVFDALGPGEIVTHGKNGFKWLEESEAVDLCRMIRKQGVSGIMKQEMWKRAQEFSTIHSHDTFLKIVNDAITAKRNEKREPFWTLLFVVVGIVVGIVGHLFLK